jgi:hypothetical protein
VEKEGRAGQATGGNMAHAQTRWKNTETLSQYVIIIAFRWQ